MNDAPEFQLVSFKICPFVQRSRIVLNHKSVPYTISYIDIHQKPEWFLNRVPTGKIPALFIDKETIFESAVINEYLDEVTEGCLLPEDPLERAKQRAWISFSETIIMQQYRMMAASTKDEFLSHRDQLFVSLGKFNDIAAKKISEPTKISLLDSAIAPVFTRIAESPVIETMLLQKFGERSPIVELSSKLLELAAVKGSVPEDFSLEFRRYFLNLNSFVLMSNLAS